MNSRYVLFISLVSALGGLLFGYDWVVIGGAKPFYEVFFGIADVPVLQGWAMSCALIGCLAGALLSGALSDRYGRKSLLLASAALFAVTSLVTGLAGSFGLFVGARIFGGMAIGLASNLSPMYIAEVSPAAVRGKYVSINQLTIVLGILAAQLTNWLIAEPVPPHATSADILNSWNGETGWRWMFWACAVPSALFFLLMWFVPESPRWLAKKRANHARAKEILARIGGERYAGEELAAIEETLPSGPVRITPRDLFLGGVRKVITVGIVIAVFQQWCGINVIFNYAQEVFSAAGYGVSDILLNIVITGGVNLVFTFVGMFTVDRLGRKALMLLGAGGLAGIYAVMGTMYFFHFQGLPLLVLVVMAIACYAMSLAPVTWVILSEIFPNRVRGAAMAVATFALWSACFVLTYTFPLLNEWLQASGTFWVYGGICLLGFWYIRRRLPETKGKTLEQIERTLTGEPSRPGVSLPLRCAGGLRGVCVAACGAAFLALLLSCTGCSAGVQGVPREEPFTVESAAAKVVRTYPEAKPVVPQAVPGVGEHRDLVYARIGARALHLDVFEPPDAAPAPRPALLFVHGGGWRSGDRSMERPLALRLAASGFVTATVEYRLSGEAQFPAAACDLRTAVRWLRAHAAEYRIDSARIGICGGSSGGNLAAFLGVTNRKSICEEGVVHSSDVQAVVDIDGPLDLTRPEESGKDGDPAKPSAAKLWIGFTYRERPDLWRQASPLTHAGPGSAPIAFINSSIERFHVGRDEMIAKLAAAKIETEVHTIPDTPHPFWLFHPWFEETARHVEAFFTRILR